MAQQQRRHGGHQRRQDDDPHGVISVSYTHLDYLRASFSPSSQTRLDKRFDEVRNAPLLVLDDLGTESATAWAREKLYQLSLIHI